MTDWADIEADAEWGRHHAADLYGDTREQQPIPTERCTIHGDYRPTSIIAMECPRCLDDDATDRADAEWDWRVSQNLRPF